MSQFNIFSFVKKHRKTAIYSVILLVLFLFSTQSGFAAEEAVLSPEDAEKVTKILNGFITGAAALMGMVTSFINIFLYPGWVNGTWFGLDAYLKTIWILISNVVYFIFAFILIAIAFMNIIGKGEGTWELKQAMPKFIIGVLIVPFSWFFIQFVLSISAILTVGVLTLPYDSFRGDALFESALDDPMFSEEKICKDIVISFNGDFTGVDGVEELNSGDADNQLDENIKCKTDGKVTIRELLTGIDEDGNVSADGSSLQNSIFGVISIYSYGILRIHELDTITGADLQSIKTIADLVFKIVFDLLFIAVYLLLMIALLLALFTRGIRLWLYAMLSPLFGLMYFFGKTGEGFGESGEKFNVKEFIALALVPVYVSAALAFGLVFILVASKGIEENSENIDTLDAGGFSLTLIGAHGDGETEEKSVIGKLIVEIFGVAILWIAVMAALGASKTTKSVIEPIQAFGKSVGELASKAPSYAPIIPAPGGMQSAASLQRLGATWTGALNARAQTQASSFMGGDGGASQEANVARERAVSNINAGLTQARDSANGLGEFLRNSEDLNSIYARRENRDYINQLQQIHIPEAERVNIQSPQDLAKAIDQLVTALNRDNGDIQFGDVTSNIDTSTAEGFNRALQQFRTGTAAVPAATAGAAAANPINNFVLNPSTHINGNLVSDQGVTDLASQLRIGRTEIGESEVQTSVRQMLASADAGVSRDDAIARVLAELSDFVEDSITS